jgi:tetrapyrrole methylase family protein/MazG family protein
MNPEASPFEGLIRLIEHLRSENGCPWDRKQTPQTLSIYLVEEVYELVEAIQSGNPDAVQEELGDVLFLLFFLASIYQGQGHFDIREAVAANTGKMRSRHPHVFGDTVVDSAADVRRNWHQIKAAEKSKREDASLLDSVPRKLPALMRAYRISERAARTGFDWHDMQGVIAKAEEEWHELKTELARDASAFNREDAALEFGDVLFTLTNVARFAKLHPETALSAATRKFEKRFARMERMTRETGQPFQDLSFDDMQALWQQAKEMAGE